MSLQHFISNRCVALNADVVNLLRVQLVTKRTVKSRINTLSSQITFKLRTVLAR